MDAEDKSKVAAAAADSAVDDETALVSCGTTAGDLVLELHRRYSPHGYDRAVALFERSYYDHSHFFRTIPGFLVQFGMGYTHDVDLKRLAEATILDDPQLDPKIPFTVGTISYAGSGPNSRTSHLFISLMADGGSFGTQLWETPIGRVVKGMDAVHKFYSGYGDMPPWGKGPVQGNIRAEGIGYMQENFPLTDAFLECQVHRSRKAPPEAAAGKYPDPKVHEQQHRRPGGEAEHPHNNIRTTAQQQQHSKKERQHAGEHHHQEHHHQQQHQQPSHHNVLNPVDGEAAQQQQQHVGGELHHQHSVHFNAAPNEEGLTKLSWELVGSCLILFLGVFCLWLRIALRGAPSKSRKTS